MRLVELSVAALKFVLMCLDKWSCAGPGIQQSVLGISHRHGKLTEHDFLSMHQIVHPIRNGFLIRYPKQLTIGSTSLRGFTFKNLGKVKVVITCYPWYQWNHSNQLGAIRCKHNIRWQHLSTDEKRGWWRDKNSYQRLTNHLGLVAPSAQLMEPH